MADMAGKFNFMDYQSPISIIAKSIAKHFDAAIENGVYKQMHEFGVIVDKDELVKALKYDREQYNKGYADGFANADKEVAIELFAAMDEAIDLICEMAGFGIKIFGKYAELKKRYIGGDEE